MAESGSENIQTGVFTICDENFSRFFHTSTSALCLTTEEEGRLVDVNDTFLRLTGFGRDSIMGKTSVELGLISHEDRIGMKNYLQNIGEFQDLKCHLARRSGKPLLVKASIRRIENGGEPHILFIADQITKTTHMQDALRESEELFSKIFHMNPDMAVITRKSDGMVIAVNDSFLQVTGFTREEVLGKTTIELRIWENQDKRSSLLGKVRERELVRDGETYLNKKSGESFPVKYSVVTVEYRGEQCLFAIGRDITEIRKAHEERERLESLLRQSQKMEALGTLAGGIAHDFNNILASIIGYSELAKAKCPDQSVLGGYLDQILQSSLRAKDLIQHILTFGRMRSAQELRPLKIAALIRETMDFLRAFIPASIEIRAQIPDLTESVRADSAQLKQLLVNIVTNALQAMKEHSGILEIGLESTEFHSGSYIPHPDLEPGPYVLLSIGDNGIGIAPEAIERIFDPYFTTKGPGKGTGLGLAIVHGIVKSHQGVITVTSTPGGGSVFSVYLPVVQEDEIQEPIPVDDEIQGGVERILLVDDEESIATFLELMLLDLGYTVTALTNPKEALALFRKDPLGFDLVITDFTMPGLNGADLTRLMRETRENIPVIMTTGFSEWMDTERASELRLNAFVNKPFQRVEVARVIRKILDEESL